MGEPLNKFISTKEAGEVMGIHYSQVTRLLNEGRLQGMKIGHDWLVFKPSINKYLETKSPRGRPPEGTPKPQTVS